jgi:hypothetical protein
MRLQMRHVRNASLALALGAAACVSPCGCGAAGAGTQSPPDDDAKAVATIAPRAVAPERSTVTDPLLARVKALAARRASAQPSLPARTAECPTPAVTAPASASTEERSCTTKSASAGLAELLPRLKTGTPEVTVRDGAGRDAFVLSPGDEIDLVVSGQPEFSNLVTVRADGAVVLPTTGDIVRAGGLSEAELASAVAAAVSPRYVRKRPSVSAVVRRSARLAYYVFGAVRKPGRYEMPPRGVSIIEAVMRASSEPRTDAHALAARPDRLEFVPVKGAEYARVRVVTPGAGARAVRLVDVARAMRGGAEALDRVFAGEIVIVPAAGGEWAEERLEAELARRTAAGPSSPGEAATP